MNINYKESQFEFFPQASPSGDNPNRPRVLTAQLTLSTENLVILMIVVIMVMIFSFSLGVERGKRASLNGAPSLGENASSLSETSTDTVLDGKANPVTPSLKGKIPLAVDVMAAKKGKGTVANDAVMTGEAKLLTGQGGTREAVPGVSSDVKTTGPSGAYTVQIASYKSEKTAKREATTLKQKGYQDVYVLPKGSYVIVCVGNFSSKADAGTFTQKLKNRYQDSVVRRL